jgi:membrane protease YdiL (CAAX protease family)
MAPAALLGALVLAAVGGLIVDLPAAAFGVSITSSHIPGGLEIADTVVQDLVFVLTAILFARMGGRKVRSWQFGLRPPRLRLLWTVLLPLGLFVAFLIFSVIWAGILDESTKEKILEQLGANEGTSLLLLSAALTCVIAPICEELLFRGFIFTALSNWKGMWPAAIITGLLSAACTSARRRWSTSCRSPFSGSGCACSTGSRARCIHVSPRTR